MEVHIVVKGDTLWKIARQYGISFEELKRVNAHLANPDYIVPGMKIFLPAHAKKNKGDHKDYKPGVDKEKAPVKHKLPVKEEKPSRPPATPIPLPPKAPQMETPPQQTPPKQQAPIPLPSPPPMPAQMPMPTPTPTPVPPAQHFPVQVQPIFGIPCGWMPIYDADCHPFMHGSHMPAVPQTRPMENPTPMPLPSVDMDSVDMMESPIYPSKGPSTMPQYQPMPDGWQMLESPENLELEAPLMDTQDSAPCPPEQGYIPQIVSPATQGGWSPLQPGFPMMPIHQHQHDCGCGCSGRQPVMAAPIQWGFHPCHCQPYPHMHAVPYPMMPNPGSNGYGAY